MPVRFTLTRLTGFGRGRTETHEVTELSLGSGAECEVRFDATWDRTVSARHAVLRFEQGQVRLVDSSREGTWVDGQKNPARPLQSGEVLELGRGGPRVKVEFALPAGPPPPSPAVPRVPKLAGGEAGGAGIPAPSPVLPPSPTGREFARPRTRGRPNWYVVGTAAVILALAGAASYYWGGWTGGSADRHLAAAAARLEQAVALVVAVIPGENGAQPAPLATAWAVDRQLFVTNAHVVQVVNEVLGRGGKVFLAINRQPDRRLEVVSAVAHPKFGVESYNFDGRPMAIAGYDIGLLHTREEAPAVMPVAGQRALRTVDSGLRVAYLGFPMEGLAGGGVDFRQPVANLQSGIVTSATDFWLSKAEFPQRLLIQHNLGATGGASGSPVFNEDGEVVGVLAAINATIRYDASSGELERAPSAAMINFAQRIDLLADLWQGYPR